MSEPLAERMRPRSLDDYVGQKHLVGPNAVLRNMIEGRSHTLFHTLGATWGRQNHARTNRCKETRNALLHAKRGDKWR